jgi:beta-lactamase superfamily II metal-dependent hydrolase
MATKKTAARKKVNGKVKPSAHRARIRMYRVGLGDCFLLTFYTEPGQNMLIDCGMYAGSRLDKKQEEKDIQLAVVNDIVSETKGRLDAVVITHEHMDHISIFNSARTIFDDKLTFKQAWFGWVEGPSQEAQNLREKYEGLRTALAASLTGLTGLASRDPDEYKDLHSRVASVAEFTGLAASGSIKERPRAAMDFVKSKAGKKNLRFGSPGDIWEFGGAKVYVLGPPPAEKQLRKLERAGASYDRALAADDGTTQDGEPWYPFSEQWRRKLEKIRRCQPGEMNNQGLDSIITRYYEARDAWRCIDNLALDSASDLALQMDNYVNNTSLVLAFEFTNGDVMLFPGDAQVGNWDSWFEIESKDFDVASLLQRTIFYKVGHHGSHNATLKPALEIMNHPKLVAMIPTNQMFARDSKHWAMPAPNLNKALQEHTRNRLLRNDQGLNNVPDPLTEANWEGLKDNVAVTELYIDYFI